MTTPTYSEMRLDLLRVVTPANIGKYLRANGWAPIDKEYRDALIFERPTVDEQIIIPTRTDFADYPMRIGDAILILAGVEKRSPVQILNELVLPPSDVIRLRVDGAGTRNGTIKYLDALNLLESGKRLLYAAVMDYARPEAFHKVLSHKDIDAFMDDCLLGQTERGSFVANIICPIDGQLTLTDNKIVNQIGRTTTQNLVKSLNHINNGIVANDIKNIISPFDEKHQISLNFFEALADMRPNDADHKLEISVQWSPIEKPDIEYSSSITMSDDQFDYIEKVIDVLRPEQKPKIEKFVGSVYALMGDSDEDGKVEGNVLLLLYGDAGTMRAKVYLNHEDHKVAMDAYWNHKRITIEGKLIWQPRMKIIEEYRNFRIF